MSVSKIHFFPDPILRKKAVPVKVFGPALTAVLKSLTQAMHGKLHAIGVAAPQIGISLQVAIVDASVRVKGTKRLILINPEILETKDEKLSREGCMSLPDYTAHLKRYDWVRFAWQDVTGNRQEMTSSGIEAVCVQHEIDHLNGILFIDRVTSLKTDMFPREKGTLT